MNEQWRPVVGHEGSYEVSDHGRVRSLDRTLATNRGVKSLKGRVLRPGPRPSGHLTVALTGHRTHNVHTLVLEAFVGPRPSRDAQARHLDGDEQNNRLTNLEWSTRARNTQDRKWHKGTRIYVLSPPETAAIKYALARGCTGASLARKYGVSRNSIYCIKHGSTHTDVEDVFA